MRLVDVVPSETLVRAAGGLAGALSLRGLVMAPVVVASVLGAALRGWNWIAFTIVVVVAAAVAFMFFVLYVRRVLTESGAALGPVLVLIRGGRAWVLNEAEDGDVFLVLGSTGAELVDEVKRSSTEVHIESGWRFGVSQRRRLRTVEYLGRTCAAREMRWVRVFLG